jgi:hypothetical protein
MRRHFGKPANDAGKAGEKARERALGKSVSDTGQAKRIEIWGGLEQGKEAFRATREKMVE